MGTSEDLCGQMRAFEARWKPTRALRAYDEILRPLGTYEGLWGHLRASGALTACEDL